MLTVAGAPPVSCRAGAGGGLRDLSARPALPGCGVAAKVSMRSFRPGAVPWIGS